jgi:hypothetical protein
MVSSGRPGSTLLLALHSGYIFKVTSWISKTPIFFFKRGIQDLTVQRWKYLSKSHKNIFFFCKLFIQHKIQTYSWLPVYSFTVVGNANDRELKPGFVNRCQRFTDFSFYNVGHGRLSAGRMDLLLSRPSGWWSGPISEICLLPWRSPATSLESRDKPAFPTAPDLHRRANEHNQRRGSQATGLPLRSQPRCNPDAQAFYVSSTSIFLRNEQLWPSDQERL